jgi:hypothetical protein
LRSQHDDPARLLGLVQRRDEIEDVAVRQMIVGDAQVGLVKLDGPPQRGSVVGDRDHLMARVAQREGQRVEKEQLAVGQDDPLRCNDGVLVGEAGMPAVALRRGRLKRTHQNPPLHARPTLTDPWFGGCGVPATSSRAQRLQDAPRRN